MKKKKKLVETYSPYFSSIMVRNIVYTLDRDIHVSAKDEIMKFENVLKKKNLKFIKRKIGEYYRYWIVF